MYKIYTVYISNLDIDNEPSVNKLNVAAIKHTRQNTGQSQSGHVEDKSSILIYYIIFIIIVNHLSDTILSSSGTHMIWRLHCKGSKKVEGILVFLNINYDILWAQY